MLRFIVALLFFQPFFAWAGEEEIAALYTRGLGGDKQAVIDCIAALEGRLAQEPGDQLARVYLGSAWTLRSRDLPISPGKLSALRKGIAFMDEAATGAPNDCRVLLLRAITNEAFPSILGRRRTAWEQLDELVALVEKNPEKLSDKDRQLLYLNAGEAARRAGDLARAKALWQRGLTINGDDKLHAEIQRALAD